MPDFSKQVDAMKPVAGIKLGCAPAGIKYQNRDDLVLMEICEGASVAAVFTRNAFCAAPVIIAKKHLEAATPRYLLINAGNANAGTGEEGVEDALASCQAVAKLVGDTEQAVLPFSTGVIGERLPVQKIIDALPAAMISLAEDNWQQAASAIMTTDTVPKGISILKKIDGHSVTVTGMIKGSGMICPDMATLLAYVATDAKMPTELLQSCLTNTVNNTLNRITVDGDTSTNDACVLVATGKSSLPEISEKDSDVYQQFSAMVMEVCAFLATAVIRDGEGATKFVQVEVKDGKSEQECQQVAYTIAHSPLVKTALFASDPNWGRILAAVGRAGIEDLDIDRINIFLNGVCIVSNGGRDKNYTEAQGQQAMSASDITITVELNRGTALGKVWTCDFSYDYVKINAEYRT